MRIMVALSMRTTLQSSTTVAVAVRVPCPARQDSPKNAPLFPNGDNGFLALLRHHGQLDLARVDIEHRLGYLPLRKQRLSLQELEARFTFADLGEKQLGVTERRS